MIDFDEIVELIDSNPKKAWLEAIKLLKERAVDYGIALTAYASEFITAKESGYKKSVAQCSLEAGERTNFRHKQLWVEIQAIRALIDFIAYTVRGDQESAHNEGPHSPAPEATSEFSSETEEE